MEMHATSHGYYTVSFCTAGSKRLLHSNNDRAFIISQLQDLLSPRLLITAVPPYKQLASCIDLLAFSIRPETIQLLLFAIDSSIITQLTTTVCNRLSQYQNEYHPSTTALRNEPRIVVKKLKGPHEALAYSVSLHLQHDDWEYDRYSSIGFYLHDRRGDWMRTWRLTQLYENDTATYHLLVDRYIHDATYQQQRLTLQSYAA